MEREKSLMFVEEKLKHIILFYFIFVDGDFPIIKDPKLAFIGSSNIYKLN